MSNIEYTGETITLTPNPEVREVVLAAAGLRCYCPGDCACRPRFTGDYRAVSPPCGCRQHESEAGNVSAGYLAALFLALLPGTLVAFVLASLAGGLAGVA